MKIHPIAQRYAQTLLRRGNEVEEVSVLVQHRYPDVPTNLVAEWNSQFEALNQADTLNTIEALDASFLANVIPVNRFTVVHGKPSAMLGEFAFDLASSHACGISCLGSLATKLKTLYISRDGGPGKFETRLFDLGDRYPTKEYFRVIYKCPRAHIVLSRLKQEPDFQLVVIDKIAGLADISILRYVAREYGCTVVAMGTREESLADRNLNLVRRQSSDQGLLITPDDDLTIRYEGGRWIASEWSLEATESENDLLRLFASSGTSMSIADLCEIADLPRATVRKRIERLHRKGFIVRVRRGCYSRSK